MFAKRGWSRVKYFLEFGWDPTEKHIFRNSPKFECVTFNIAYFGVLSKSTPFVSLLFNDVNNVY